MYYRITVNGRCRLPNVEADIGEAIGTKHPQFQEAVDNALDMLIDIYTQKNWDEVVVLRICTLSEKQLQGQSSASSNYCLVSEVYPANECREVTVTLETMGQFYITLRELLGYVPGKSTESTLIACKKSMRGSSRALLDAQNARLALETRMWRKGTYIMKRALHFRGLPSVTIRMCLDGRVSDNAHSWTYTGMPVDRHARDMERYYVKYCMSSHHSKSRKVLLYRDCNSGSASDDDDDDGNGNGGSNAASIHHNYFRSQKSLDETVREQRKLGVVEFAQFCLDLWGRSETDEYLHLRNLTKAVTDDKYV